MKIPRPTASQTQRARELRKSSSKSQQRLWNELRANRIGFKFKREVALGPFTMDFYCHEAQLCIEVDGQQHDPARDALRDRELEVMEIVTFRYTSRECFLDAPGVAKDVLRICISRTGRDPFPGPDRGTPSP